MIVIDTSALMAIVLAEPRARACATLIADNDRVLMSAATLTECMIVSAEREVDREMGRLLDGLSLSIVPLTPDRARAAGDAHRQWGKGFHPARLNYGDTFAYALAKELACPLLFIGHDFARTDVVSALA